MSNLIPRKSQEPTISLDDVDALCQFGNQVLLCQTIEEICAILFDLVEERIQPQVSSLFLFMKNGCIERVNIRGIDRKQKTISNSWLNDGNMRENYLPGESFSGNVVKSKNNSPHGEPILSNNILEEYDLKYGAMYKEKLGTLQCGISVPLNGTHRTFGTIEIINRMNPDTGKPDLVFTEKDLGFLILVGGHVSTAISRLRKLREDQVIKYLTDELIGKNKFTTINNIAEKVANALVKDELMPYKACIVRFEQRGNLYIYHASYSSDINHTRNPIRSVSQGLVGKAYKTGQSIEINSIDEKINLFLSKDWIHEFNLKSFFCFPLIYQENSVGVLSLFTGYEYELHDSDRTFLKTISCFLASCHLTIRAREDDKHLSRANAEIEARLLFQHKNFAEIMRVVYNMKTCITSDVNSNISTNDHYNNKQNIQEELFGYILQLEKLYFDSKNQSFNYESINELSELYFRNELNSKMMQGKISHSKFIMSMQKVDSLLVHEFKIKHKELENDEQCSNKLVILPMLIRVKKISWRALNIPDYHEFYRSKEGKIHIIGCYGSYQTIEKLSSDPDIISIEASSIGTNPNFNDILDNIDTSTE
jgi:GAF domain-containing protein